MRPNWKEQPPGQSLTGKQWRRWQRNADTRPRSVSSAVPELATWAMMRDRLRWSRLHGFSQDEEERGGVVNRGARDERSSAIRRL